MRDAVLEESGSGKFGKKIVDFLLFGVHLFVDGTKTNSQREHASGSDVVCTFGDQGETESVRTVKVEADVVEDVVVEVEQVHVGCSRCKKEEGIRVPWRVKRTIAIGIRKTVF